ncbi:MAG: AraC family transcriptional regulator, partial [Actinomycetes bacterium]
RLLRSGDFALVPHGEGHAFYSDAAVPPVGLFDLPRQAVSERYEILRHGGGGAATSMVCGVVRFDHPAAERLVRLLPKLLCFDATSAGQHEWMQHSLRLMTSEARTLLPGGETIIPRLADILVIQAIRTWLRADPAARDGWLGAMSDHHIGRAISLLQRQPERGWTVAELAEEVAMSRAAFAARFAALVGEPPMHYLTRWRMYLALDALENEGSSVKGLAHQFGYRSEAAFSRTFKRVIGCPPGSVRRGRRAAPRSDGAGALRAHHGR